jgi:hypothetical protein
MIDSTLNVCIRCGKPRVEVKTWKECIKGSIIIHTSTACPDTDCQKVVAGKLAIQKQKREAQEKERLKRAQARKR